MYFIYLCSRAVIRRLERVLAVTSDWDETDDCDACSVMSPFNSSDAMLVEFPSLFRSIIVLIEHTLFPIKYCRV